MVGRTAHPHPHLVAELRLLAARQHPDGDALAAHLQPRRLLGQGPARQVVLDQHPRHRDPAAVADRHFNCDLVVDLRELKGMDSVAAIVLEFFFQHEVLDRQQYAVMLSKRVAERLVLYRSLVDSWVLYDNSDAVPVLLDWEEKR